MKKNIGVQVTITDFGTSPMRAIENNLVIQQMNCPNPDILSPQDVLIDIHYAALSWVDLLMTCGLYQHRATTPYTPGLEYSGIIRWMGGAVPKEKFFIGQRVYVGCFEAGPRTSGPYQKYGGFASFGVAPFHSVQTIPSAFTFAQACNFSGNYETAYHCLVACGKLQKGETILIHGASGATGLAAVHLAKIIGATVIATGRDRQKLNEVKKHGADHLVVIEHKTDGRLQPFRKIVKDLTKGKGVDVVYDPVGGDISIESLRAMRFAGRFLVVGWASTPFVRIDKPNQLPTNLILLKGLQIIGCPAVIGAQKHPEIRKPRVAALRYWANEGLLTPYVSAIYDIHEIRKAMRDKWEGRIIGGCAIKLPKLSV